MTPKDAKNDIAKNCNEQPSLVFVKETIQLLSGK